MIAKHEASCIIITEFLEKLLVVRKRLFSIFLCLLIDSRHYLHGRDNKNVRVVYPVPRRMMIDATNQIQKNFLVKSEKGPMKNDLLDQLKTKHKPPTKSK